MTANKILIAAGGTGGHVFPAIATAEALTKRGYKVYFATDKRGEKYLKPSGYDYKIISSASPNGIAAIFKLLLGALQSAFLLGCIRPKLVVGFGGYPSFPPLFAAKLLLIKTILHEQNSVLGKANRFLAKHASVTATSFPHTINAKNARLTGNPVRSQMQATPYPALDGKINILITGGSQGAKLFAHELPEALAEFRDKITITQQVRDEDLAAVKAKYEAAGVQNELQSFFSDMPERLKNAHLLVCRAGASTIFELAATGRPAIFVPLAISAENHQFYNAKAACDIGGGWLLEEKNFNKSALSAMLGELLADKAKLRAAAENIRNLAADDAAGRLADLIVEVATK